MVAVGDINEQKTPRAKQQHYTLLSLK